MNTLYTYGYARGSIADLKHYAAAGCLILDIRFQPYSRRPEWRREGLAATLGERYVWCQALGNVYYLLPSHGIQLHNADAGLGLLAAFLAIRPVVLLCACIDPRTCHRDLVATLAGAFEPPPVVVDLWPGDRIALQTRWRE